MSDQPARDALADLISALRPERADGRAASDFLVPGNDSVADELLARVVAQPVRRRRWPWRRTTFVVIGVSALVGAGVTTAVLITREPSDRTYVVCTTSLDDEANSFTLAPEAGVSPVDLCRPLWADGRLGVAEAPRLTACAPPEGPVRVVPGDEGVCAVNGWQLAATDVPGDHARDAEITSELSSAFTDTCFDRAEAEATARDVLVRLELADWTVDMGAFVDGRCNGPAHDARTKTISFAPI